MNWLKSCVIAFSMYSKIPMPNISWEEKGMRYALCFFPLIGIVIGGLCYVWILLCNLFSIGNLAASAGYVVLPLLVTGGIHADGYLDTMDAIHSYQPKEKKLEILKDPHVGAFGILSTIVYSFLYFGGISEIKEMQSYLMLWVAFVVSRTLSGLSLVCFKSAKKDGILYTFASKAHKKIVFGILLGYLLCGVGLWFFLSVKTALLLILGGITVSVSYIRMSMKLFGGITGDLAGCYLQVLELSAVLLVAIGGHLWN